MSHTPGPWMVVSRARKDDSELRWIAVEDVFEHRYSARRIAHIIGDPGPRAATESNARLIAAAPDLLEACIDWTEDPTECGCDTFACKGTCLPARTRAAIAKARGEA